MSINRTAVVVVLVPDAGASSSVIVSKLYLQTSKGEFESHCALHLLGKEFRKLQLVTHAPESTCRVDIALHVLPAYSRLWVIAFLLPWTLLVDYHLPRPEFITRSWGDKETSRNSLLSTFSFFSCSGLLLGQERRSGFLSFRKPILFVYELGPLWVTFFLVHWYLQYPPSSGVFMHGGRLLSCEINENVFYSS